MHTENSPLRRVSSDDSASPGELAVPPGAHALLLMVFATAAERESAGYRFLADVLQANGIATLAFDMPPPHRRRGAPAPGRADPWANALGTALRFAADGAHTTSLPVGLLAVDQVVPACLAACRSRELQTLCTLVLIDGHPDLTPQSVGTWRRPVLCLAGRSTPADTTGSAPQTRQLPSPHRACRLPGQTHPHADAGTFEAMACETVAWLNQTLPRCAAAPRGPGRKPLASPLPRSIVSPTTPPAGALPWPISTTTRWG